MHCFNCGAIIEDWYKFCRECGSNLDNEIIARNAPDDTSSAETDVKTDSTQIPEFNSLQIIETEKPTVWQRFWARSTDLIIEIFTVVMILLLVFSLDKLCENYYAKLLIILTVIPVAILLDALTYKICGNTLCKKLFSIKIVDAKNLPLTANAYLKRNFLLLLYGLGFGIFPLCLFAAAWQYQKIDKGEETTYDQKFHYQVFHAKHGMLKSVLAYVFSFILLSIVFAFWIYFLFYKVRQLYNIKN
jgi:uncharacterized RDD family membrane protein YckC